MSDYDTTQSVRWIIGKSNGFFERWNGMHDEYRSEKLCIIGNIFLRNIRKNRGKIKLWLRNSSESNHLSSGQNGGTLFNGQFNSMGDMCHTLHINKRRKCRLGVQRISEHKRFKWLYERSNNIRSFSDKNQSLNRIAFLTTIRHPSFGNNGHRFAHGSIWEYNTRIIASELEHGRFKRLPCHTSYCTTSSLTWRNRDTSNSRIYNKLFSFLSSQKQRVKDSFWYTGIIEELLKRKRRTRKTRSMFQNYHISCHKLWYHISESLIIGEIPGSYNKNSPKWLIEYFSPIMFFRCKKSFCFLSEILNIGNGFINIWECIGIEHSHFFRRDTSQLFSSRFQKLSNREKVFSSLWKNQTRPPRKCFNRSREKTLYLFRCMFRIFSLNSLCIGITRNEHTLKINGNTQICAENSIRRSVQKRSIFCEKRVLKRNVRGSTLSEERSFGQKRTSFPHFLTGAFFLVHPYLQKRGQILLGGFLVSSSE